MFGKRLGLFVLLMSAFGIVLTAPGQIGPKRASARTYKLLELCGVRQMGDTSGEQIIAELRRVLPQVAEVDWVEAQKEINTDALMDMLVPVYERHFTAEEVDQLIAFYETPIGRKLAEAQPALGKETIAIAQRWGENQGRKIMNKLKERGVQLR